MERLMSEGAVMKGSLTACEAMPRERLQAGAQPLCGYQLCSISPTLDVTRATLCRWLTHNRHGKAGHQLRDFAVSALCPHSHAAIFRAKIVRFL